MIQYRILSFRCVTPSSCSSSHRHSDFANAISERRGTGDVDDWEETALCGVARDDNAQDTFVRSDSDDEEKVCCKEEHIEQKPSCSAIKDTHRYKVD